MAIAKVKLSLTPEEAKEALANWAAFQAAIQEISLQQPFAIQDGKLEEVGSTKKYFVGAFNVSDSSYVSTQTAKITLNVTIEQAKEFVRKLALNEEVRYFCVGIKNIPLKDNWRACLVRRMSSGKSYVARGYNHMIAFYTATERALVVNMEKQLHDTFNSHTKWDPDTYNVRGGVPGPSEYHLVYVAFRVGPEEEEDD